MNETPKTLERLLYIRIYDHFEPHLSSAHCGFTENKSAILQMLSYISGSYNAKEEIIFRNYLRRFRKGVWQSLLSEAISKTYWLAIYSTGNSVQGSMVGFLHLDSRVSRGSPLFVIYNPQCALDKLLK